MKRAWRGRRQSRRRRASTSDATGDRRIAAEPQTPHPEAISRCHPAAVRIGRERALGLGQIERLYRGISAHSNPCEFARAALERLGARFDVRPDEQFRIPSSGAAIVVANHPFGGLEGLFMIWLLKCLRDDVRVLANFGSAPGAAMGEGWRIAAGVPCR